MDALKSLGLCALLAAQPQTSAPCGPVAQIESPEIDRWQAEIAAASKRFGIPAEWIRAVMARESAGHTLLYGAPIVSSAGAMGLMQLMPGTWSELRTRYDLGSDPFDPHDNIFAGTAYLREMFDRYGYPGLFAAYHAGPGRMDAYLSGRKLLPIATQIYLDSLVRGAKTRSDTGENRPSMTSKPPSQALFFARERDGETPSGSAEPPREEKSLFVPLGNQRVSARHWFFQGSRGVEFGRGAEFRKAR